MLTSSIAQIGMQYSLIVKAVNCSSGEVLTSAEARARDKDHVLDALSKVATEEEPLRCRATPPKYQDFLTLWKDADPDIPILKQAEGEYAKLK